jgi:hypothetical protein
MFFLKASSTTGTSAIESWRPGKALWSDLFSRDPKGIYSGVESSCRLILLDIEWICWIQGIYSEISTNNHLITWI